MGGPESCWDTFAPSQGCFGYLALSFTGLLYPAYEEKVYNLAQPFMLAEVAIMLWLAIMGAKEQRLAAAES